MENIRRFTKTEIEILNFKFYKKESISSINTFAEVANLLEKYVLDPWFRSLFFLQIWLAKVQEKFQAYSYCLYLYRLMYLQCILWKKGTSFLWR